MIVVIDTSVWVSGLQFASSRSVPTRALQKAFGQDVIVTCSEIESEILRVLTEKFKVFEQRASEVLYAMLSRSVRVSLAGNVRVCRDPGDDMFLECALRAKAELLVTGDNDLLVLKEFRGTRMVTPSVYVHAA